MPFASTRRKTGPASLERHVEQVSCPNCGADPMHRFYAVDDVPAFCCALMKSRQSAIDCPRGDLKLAVCRGCGFVANTAFDPAVNPYSANYEETQTCSATFNAFARQLARNLAERYELRGKTVLEIGCGKGEFLALLCEIGDCRGIGIDPAFRPDRVPDGAARSIEFIADLYDARYAHLKADFIVCRHTLEHIPATLEFLSVLREAIGDRTDTVVCFEVPDVGRILRDGAFWDLYYEHCSYFTPGSLARLFRSKGFSPIDLELAYDNQYVLIAASPDDDQSGTRAALEDDLEDVLDAVDRFESVCGPALARWRRYVFDAPTDDRIVLWGSSSKAVAFLSTLGVDHEIEYVVDINPRRHGKFMPGTGQEIVSPEFLRRYRPGRVVVMNPVYLQEIGRQIADMGLTPEVLAV